METLRLQPSKTIDLADKRPVVRGNAGDFGVVRPAACRDRAVDETGLVSVVPFIGTRPHALTWTAPKIQFDGSAHALEPPRSSGAQIIALVAVSLLAHAAIFYALNRETMPIASVGEQVITIEIVLGADAPAGLAARPSEGEAEVKTAEVKEPERMPASTIREDKIVREAATAEKPKITIAEPVTEARTETAEPAPVVPPREEEPVEIVHDEPKPDPKPEPKVDPAPKPSVAALASNNIGRGRSVNDSNYLGRLVAHLARHKRFPAEARSRRQQGRAVVSFGLDESGRVSWVKLVSGTGFAALDREVEAMVHRASPFPQPPGGQSASYTAPVSFTLK